MTKSSHKRKEKRVSKSLAKKSAADIAKSNGVDLSKHVSADPLVQGAKIAALEKAMQQIVAMTQENHTQIVKAFGLTDAHLWVLRQLCKDIVGQTVVMLTTEPPAVNLEAYYDLFNAHMASQIKAAEQAPELPMEPEAPEEFGGDSHASP